MRTFINHLLLLVHLVACHWVASSLQVEGTSVAWLPLLLMAGSMLAGAKAGSVKPGVAEFEETDLEKMQEEAIASNQESLAALDKLAKDVNSMSVEQMTAAMEQLTPGITTMRGTTTSTIQSFLEGRLPQDVVDQTRRLSAEAGVLGGFGPDSGMGRALTARDLGLTTLNLVDRGLNAAQGWLEQAHRMTPTFDFTSMFITPQQKAQQDRANKDGKQEEVQQRENVNAQAKANMWGAVSQGLGTMAGFMGKGAGAGGSSYVSPIMSRNVDAYGETFSKPASSYMTPPPSTFQLPAFGGRN